ncbi:Flp pilus assembly complex ATPase component TadA [Demequina sp. TTPB684]|uniref:CpaF family protein n=1 Tax=unclassified Demequina TaxID=2620311 RepID=UPI001CF5EA79|nr:MULTISPECIES: ATPase, T2SS/T4P/T4SS family [unclassified Demequina]MCB2413557.1 Flp pilus assembly complex ATPase component TadA [Demequina sp. TTPB684]UPU87223.1 Flp pilus assembly complex ATPase component TadA [Demequina sp. TMPB413]
MGAETTIAIESQVRDQIRKRGVDPVRDVAAVRALVDDALAAWEERALVGAVAPVEDRAALAKSVLDNVAGLGPLQQYLDDPDVEEIWINEPSQVYVARRGASELTSTMLTAQQVRDLVEQMLKLSGRRLDLSSPFVDASLPGGERLHAVIPDVTREHWSVNIRKYVARANHVQDLVALGSLPAQAAAFLGAAVASGLNVLVAGATQAGKTTFLNALAGSIPPRERVITCEEVFELKIPLRDVVGLQCRQPSLEGTGEIPLRRLVKEALRMRPDRIIIGEVREAESLDMLVALNAGVPGMCTIHANTARDAITKMCTLPLLAGDNVSDRFVVPTVASAIDIVVHLELDGRGKRRVREIVGVPGRVEQGIIEISELFHLSGNDLVRGEGYPPHEERFARAGVRLSDLLARQA